ncbi:hypothetical protein Tco_0237666 [Tanacetum coccineum]
MSTSLIPPKKTRGKGSKGKKQAVTPKKKGSISASDNIILEPDVAFELRKSMSLTETEEEEAARRVHATHERLVTVFDESDPEPANRPTGRRRPYGIAFRDTSSMSKKKSLDQSQKLKGIQTLAAEEQLAADTMQALNASKKISKSQSHTGGSSEGAGVSPEVLDESTDIFTISSEGTENKGDRSNEAHVEEEEIEWLTIDEEEEKQVDQDDDDRSINIEEIDNDEKTDDEFVHGDEYVHDDGDHEQARKLPPTSSSLSILSGFGNQFLNLPSDISLIGTVKDSAEVEINSLLDIQIQQEIKQEQASKQKWPKHSSTPFDKTIENEYKQKDILFKMMLASKSYEKHHAHQALYYDALIQSPFMDEDDIDQVAAPVGESALLKRTHDDQDEDPTAGSNQGKDNKRPRKDTQSSKKSHASKESSKGNTPPKSSKSGKSITIEEPDEEYVHHISLNAQENIIDEMGKVNEQPDGEAEPNTENAPKNDWFKQPPRPPTPDPEWNKCQVVDDQPEQTWFNDLVSAQKYPLTFDKLMATPIDFSKFAKNRLKLDKITEGHLPKRH